MGYAMVAGGKPDMAAPSAGILASDLSVGSVVKLMEGGVAVEYLVVNQGIPGNSSLYDASCDGLWLLRKELKENRQWHSSNVNDYQNSTIHAWLNSNFINQLGSIEQSAIKQVKIPYVNGTGGSAVSSGASGILTKAFLLSMAEVGISNPFYLTDGAKLSYFDSGTEASAKRVANLNGSANLWFLRSAATNATTIAGIIRTDGSSDAASCSVTSVSIRPSLILPSTAVFDETTMLLKGVA